MDKTIACPHIGEEFKTKPNNIERAQGCNIKAAMDGYLR